MTAPSRFRDIPLKIKYRGAWGAAGEILDEFLIPVLSVAEEYHRNVGYFSSGYLTAASAGFAKFVYHGGNIRLLCGAQLYEHDVNAITGGVDVNGDFATRLASELIPEDEIARKRLEVLAWLYANGRLAVKIAIPYDGEKPYVSKSPNDPVPYWHKKIGYFVDPADDEISFNGSLNDSTQAMTRNAETVEVHMSWTTPEYVESDRVEFEDNWNGGYGNFRVIELPQAVREHLLTFAPDTEPSPIDPCEKRLTLDVLPDAVPVDARTAFTYYAPRLENAQSLAEATSGVTLQPHQRQVHARLADLYPRSWIVADEVGLGKTISAGISLRRLYLSKQVKRALILAPANLCLNWQNEFFEKLGLWVPRLVNRTIVSPDPTIAPRPLRPGENAYEIEKVLIVSSHLARRSEQTAQLLAAAQRQPFDLVIVDEAHHARISGEGTKSKRNRLLTLLDGLNDQRTARTLWLLTATPMQTSVTDLHCLLAAVGLANPFDDIARFERYYEELVKPQPDWEAIQSIMSRSPVRDATSSYDQDEMAFLQASTRRIGHANTLRVQRYTDGSKGLEETVLHSDFLRHPESQDVLREWLRLHGPVERFVTRHTRATLRDYIARGLLDQPLASRDVASPGIPFSDPERELFKDLRDHIQRLEQAVGAHVGRTQLILNNYEQRLTSSWAAIEKSLFSRLEKTPLRLEDDDDDDDVDGDEIDHTTTIPLLPAEKEQIRGYIQKLNEIQRVDSKFALLEKCIREARDGAEAIIVFTQFTDTLDYLRDKLTPVLGQVLATYSGEGGRLYESGDWMPMSKAHLVDAVRSGRVQVLLATDAAAEGLNLQTCSYLVNYDMPWNPMRVEQRIGRIDRLGQRRSIVTIKNFFVSDVERNRYHALADRIVDFNTYIGGLPPILGVVEPDFIRNPLRDMYQSTIVVDDQLPIPQYQTSPITAQEYASVVRDQLQLDAGFGNRVTWDLAQASADRENWKAMATYGHPLLDKELALRVEGKPTLLTIEDDKVLGIVAIGGNNGSGGRLIDRFADINGSVQNDLQAESLAKSTVERIRATRLAQEYNYAFQSSKDTRRQALTNDCVALAREIIGIRLGAEAFTSGVSLSPPEALLSAVAGYDSLHHFVTLIRLLSISDDRLFHGVVPEAVRREVYIRRMLDFNKQAAVLVERYANLEGG